MKTKSDGLVLVVDDIAENRALATAFLRKLGWNVLEAASGLAAVEMLEKVVPSHILLDVRMPGFDGLSVARYVREAMNDHKVRIVGYTAHALPDEIQTFLRSGFDAVLIKPITYADISSEFGPANTEFC
ncbi:response regulator [Hydrogenophaga sp.]|uniref:response regulator n=1 Tax=Hydrogenophaga sp. TaxID=1904254 RepID=UPI0035B42B94